MTRHRLRTILLSAAVAIAVYGLLGFLLVPRLAHQRLVAYVERDLGHRLSVGEIRFNPFTFELAVSEVDLRDPAGGRLLAWRRLGVDLETRSLWRRAWVFRHIRLEAPHLNGELRADGRHNFSALLDTLPAASEPRAALPRVSIDRIELVGGRIDLADLQAGDAARLALSPIDFELSAFNTEVADRASYRLSARSTEGERIDWQGDLSLDPVASDGWLELKGWHVATVARWLGRRIAIERAAGTIDLAGQYRAGYANGTPMLAVSHLDATLAQLVLSAPGAGEPLAAVQSMTLSGGTFDLASRSLGIERLQIAGANIALAIDAQGRSNWPIVAPAAGGTAAAAPTAWSARVGRVGVADSALSFADRRAASAATFALTGLVLEFAAQASHTGAATTAELSAAKLAADRISHHSEQQAMEIDAASVAVSAVTFDLGAHTRSLRGQAMTARAAVLALRSGKRAWRVQKVSAAAEMLRSTSDGSDQANAASGISIEAGAFGGHVTQDIQSLESSHLSARAQTLRFEPGAGAGAGGIRAAGITGNVRDLRLRDPASGGELARIAQAEFGGGVVDTVDRRVSFERLLVADARAGLVIGADGKSDWERLLAAFAANPDTAARRSPAPARQAQWATAVRSVEVRNFRGGYIDRRHDPALQVEFSQLDLRARDASSERSSPLQLEASGRINDGGHLRVTGRIDLHALAADLTIKATDLPLAMLQPYIARHARVQAVSGLAAVDGRLRYGMARSAGADLLFEGALAMGKLVLEETEPAQPLLSADEVRASQVSLALRPGRLEIQDVRVSRLGTRLIIAPDQSVNFSKLLRPRPKTGDPATPGPASQPDATAETFPVAVSSIRLRDSVLEFADLSLRPQFQARMHELQGVITGLSTHASARARMELEGRVDEFGSAQIRGSLSPFQLHRFTDMTLSFRNLEMTALTPYTAKFAGYRIASGKLSLDLHYRLQNRALVGDNKIVVDKLELGERVQSPSALDLPLELAIAILKDENGRIDIGLPVAGSLDDPQFDVGAIVWKALGSLLGRIVTAPFRALGRLFGSAEGDTLGAIEFAPGAARLAPPERQKLQTVAEALAKRPDLTLTVNPAYAAAADLNALQSLALRRSALARSGIVLEADEAPGPLDYSSARTRLAIEALYIDAFGLPALRDLRAQLAKTPATPTDADAEPRSGSAITTDASIGKPPPAPADTATRSDGLMLRAMTQRLVEAQPIGAAELSALAQQRAAHIAQSLQGSGRISPARIAIGEPRASADATQQPVVVKLQLGVAR